MHPPHRPCNPVVRYKRACEYDAEWQHAPSLQSCTRILPRIKETCFFKLSESDIRLSEGRTTHASILVVDHDRVSRDAASRLLADTGYRVQTAESGNVSLHLLRESLPDLVLLAVAQPSLDKFDALKKIRQQYSESLLPVIMIMSDTEPQQGATAFREGASDFLTRPIDDEILLARISLHLQHRHAQAELLRSQERYALAAQGAQIGLWDLDIVRQQIFLSSRWKELLGFAEDELDSTIPIWFDRMHKDDRDSFIEIISRPDSLDNGRFDCELRMRHRDELIAGCCAVESCRRTLTDVYAAWQGRWPM